MLCRNLLRGRQGSCAVLWQARLRASLSVSEPSATTLSQSYRGFRRLDFSNASEDDLRKLAECCDPASFGRNHEAVFDENYRKAGKLDVEHFAAIFDPERCGLMNQLRCLLLEGHDETTGVRSELYKLNLYGMFWTTFVYAIRD